MTMKGFKRILGTLLIAAGTVLFINGFTAIPALLKTGAANARTLLTALTFIMILGGAGLFYIGCRLYRAGGGLMPSAGKKGAGTKDQKGGKGPKA